MHSRHKRVGSVSLLLALGHGVLEGLLIAVAKEACLWGELVVRDISNIFKVDIVIHVVELVRRVVKLVHKVKLRLFCLCYPEVVRALGVLLLNLDLQSIVQLLASPVWVWTL